MFELGQQAIMRNQPFLFTAVDNSVDNLSSQENLNPAIISSQEIWNQAITTLQNKLTPQNFDLWFRPITCIGLDEKHISLVVPNRFIRDWFENHYLKIVLEQIYQQTQKTYEIIWLIDERVQWPKQEALTQIPSKEKELPVIKPQIANGPPTIVDLIPRYTFDTFVTGPSNQLAEASSRAVAQNPGTKYNPLFIYGGVGLGKTHLLHAIGHQIYQQHPHWRIVYVKAETFMNEYIHQLRNNKIEEFRSKYRHQVDVLLMDDIQYLAGKERTQDEFFHTFNSLFEKGKQIIVTADQYPHQIPDLEDRIRSRFQWGLIADIQAPDLETRIAILAKKAEYEHINLPPDVAYYLAANIKSNVRELEGLLIRVIAVASMQNKSISVEFVKESLRQFLTHHKTSITLEDIQRHVAGIFHVSTADLKSTSRQKSIARPRQIAMYLSRKLCRLSYPDIAAHFGGKDHTTVLAACRKVESLLQTDQKFRQEVVAVEQILAPSA